MIDNLKKIYNQWSQQQLKLEDSTDFIEITTPFVDMNHDYIQLFFTQEGTGKYKITDDGHIINELAILGVDVNNTTKRKEFFNQTLKIFGVNYDKESNELFISFDNLDDYPKRQHNLLQCILRISDMLLTAKSTVASIFAEEIASFFEENNVFYSQDLGFIGKSGNQQTFDFVLPHSKKKREKLIKAVNTPSADNYTNAIFPFIDVQGIRPNSEFFVIANDTNIPIAEKFSSSLKSYDVGILPWSNRLSWVDELKVV